MLYKSSAEYSYVANSMDAQSDIKATSEIEIDYFASALLMNEE